MRILASMLVFLSCYASAKNSTGHWVYGFSEQQQKTLHSYLNGFKASNLSNYLNGFDKTSPLFINSKSEILLCNEEDLCINTTGLEVFEQMKPKPISPLSNIFFMKDKVVEVTSEGIKIKNGKNRAIFFVIDDSLLEDNPYRKFNFSYSLSSAIALTEMNYIPHFVCSINRTLVRFCERDNSGFYEELVGYIDDYIKYCSDCVQNDALLMTMDMNEVALLSSNEKVSGYGRKVFRLHEDTYSQQSERYSVLKSLYLLSLK